jgi:hypothetical protein
MPPPPGRFTDKQLPPALKIHERSEDVSKQAQARAQNNSDLVKSLLGLATFNRFLAA